MGFKFNPFTGTLDVDTNTDTTTTDAESLQGVAISTTAPSDGEVLSYNSTSEEWEPATASGGGISATNPDDNVIARFDGTTGDIQGYTSNAPTINDSGVASFGDDSNANCERIGAGSSVSGANATVFGNAANALAQGTAIGQDAECATSTFGTALGFRAYSRNFGTCALGAQTIASGLQATAIGVNAQATNTFSFALGAGCRSNNQYSICAGGGVISNHDRFIGFGRQITSTQAGQAIFGGTFNVISDFYMGGQPQGNRLVDIPRDSHLYFPYIGGTTDEDARDAYINAPAGTGTGAGGHLFFETAPAGATGSNTNSWQVVFELTDDREAKFSGAIHKPIRTITTSTTITSEDYTIIANATGGSITVTLPPAADAVGRVYYIKKISSGNSVTVDADGTELIDNSQTLSLTGQYRSEEIQSDGTQWWVLSSK